MSGNVFIYGWFDDVVEPVDIYLWGWFDAEAEPSDVITDLLARSLSLFITQYRQLRTILNGSSAATLSFNSDPAQGGIEVDTENPITDHLSRAKSLFITQYRQTKVL